jgi:hypothetical protein
MEHVHCELSHAGSDVRCAVCGQGFLVHWSRLSRAEQMACRRVIRDHLRNHHTAARDTLADRRIHPRDGFPIPEWLGLAAFAAAEETKNAMEEVA